MLRFLWRSDPFKAKWAILAKAYSIIRDDNPGKGVTLESFLSLNTDFIGIVAPADYLNAMGLQLIVDEEGNYSLEGGNPASTSNAAQTSTNHSVDDIVNHCYDTGYVTGTAPVNSIGHQGAFVAQPNVQVNTNSNTSIGPVSGTTSNAMATTITGSNHNQASHGSINAGGANAVQLNNGVATNANASIPHIGAAVSAGNFGNGSNTSATGTAGNSPNPYQVSATQFLNMRNNGRRNNQYAEDYYGLLNPERDPIYIYNPYGGVAWDAFDLNDFVNM